MIKPSGSKIRPWAEVFGLKLQFCQYLLDFHREIWYKTISGQTPAVCVKKVKI